MRDLGAAFAAGALPRAELPVYDEHHKAKHRLLEEYMKVWLAKLAQSHPQVVIVDGFASAGRYQDGRIGSPLILLHGYLSHAARGSFKAPPHFVFIESKRSFAANLQAEVEAIDDLHGARVDVLHGEYEDLFPRAVRELHARYGQLPTFAFVDPLGYEKTPYALLSEYRRLMGQRAEAMVYVPVDHMARFAGTSITEAALDRAYGSREAWEQARDQEETGKGRAAVLADAYAEVLAAEYQFVSRFAVDPASRNRYYLFFGTDSIAGLKAMKHAYWKVDPEDGRGYRQDRLAAGGQGGLFDAAVETPKEPEEDLTALVREHFGDRTFTIDELERFVLTDSAFRETHVRKIVLNPARDLGQLEIVEHTGTSGFPPGTRMRFVA